MSYAAWSPYQVYSINDVVRYLPNNALYVSLQNGNLNNNPTIVGTSFWTPVGGGGSFVNSLNAESGDLTITGINGVSVTNTGANFVVSGAGASTVVNSVQTSANDGAGALFVSPTTGNVLATLKPLTAPVQGTYPYPTAIYVDQYGRATSLAGGNPLSGVVAGTGLATNGVDTLTNTGVLSLTAGTGIVLGGTAQSPVINSTGVLSLTAGSGIVLGGTAQSPVINSTIPYSGASSLSSSLQVGGFDGGGNLNNAPTPNVNSGFGVIFSLNATDPTTGLSLSSFNRLVLTCNAYYNTNDSANNSYVICAFKSNSGESGTIGQYVFQSARSGGDDPATQKFLNGTRVLQKGTDYQSATTSIFVGFCKNSVFPNSRLGWFNLIVSLSPTQ